MQHSVERFDSVSSIMPKLRLIRMLKRFLGSRDSLVFSELLHSLAPRPFCFIQSEDGIRDKLVTGVQTCALPIYPGLMLEWYPHVLIVSHLIPRSPARTTNVVEFYYPEEIALFERDFVEAQQAAYVETALEDEEICKRLDAGRRALWQQGLDDAGPYQSPMEDAEVHFHEWLHARLDRSA